MIDVNSHNTSMKIKWLKKLVASGNGDCYIFVNGIFDTQTIFSLGSLHCEQIVRTIKNDLLMDVPQSFTTYIEM